MADPAGAAPHRLSRTDARRIAIRAQLLAAPRPDDLLEVVRHLTLVQADPASSVVPSAELVAWSRLGQDYRRGDLDAAVADGSLIELQGMLRPAEDIALYRAEMAAWPGVGTLPDWRVAQRDWIEANDGCRRDIMDKLYDEGPLPSRALPDTTVLPWRSSGWNNDRNVRMLLDIMVARGEVAAAGHDGRTPLWDLAERIYPEVSAVPVAEAPHQRNVRRLRALGIARANATACPVDANHVGDAGEPAVIDGVRGTWRVDPAYLDGTFTGRTALLSPLDRLVYDRKRMDEIFEFDYQLEMFKPAAKRRWGYWALPILSGDRLVGKVDATADRTIGVLRVDAIHEDVVFTKKMTTVIRTEIEGLADWLGLALTLVSAGGRTALPGR